jgi:hypothetical protein
MEEMQLFVLMSDISEQLGYSGYVQLNWMSRYEEQCIDNEQSKTPDK